MRHDKDYGDHTFTKLFTCFSNLGILVVVVDVCERKVVGWRVRSSVSTCEKYSLDGRSSSDEIIKQKARTGDRLHGLRRTDSRIGGVPCLREGKVKAKGKCNEDLRRQLDGGFMRYKTIFTQYSYVFCKIESTPIITDEPNMKRT